MGLIGLCRATTAVGLVDVTMLGLGGLAHFASLLGANICLGKLTSSPQPFSLAMFLDPLSGACLQPSYLKKPISQPIH